LDLATIAKSQGGFSVIFSPVPLLHFLAIYGKIPIPANGNHFQFHLQKGMDYKDGQGYKDTDRG
jgi:hypothetical protein